MQFNGGTSESLLQRRTTRGLPLVATFASKSRLSGDREASTSLARLSLSEAKYVNRGGRPYGGFPSLNGIVSLQRNLYATRQNPQSNVKYVLMATSSSVFCRERQNPPSPLEKAFACPPAKLQFEASTEQLQCDLQIILPPYKQKALPLDSEAVRRLK